MIEIDGVILSDDVMDEFFVCNLDQCKGACCIEGDLGAPLTDDELEQIELAYPEVAPYLTNEGRAAIAAQG